MSAVALALHRMLSMYAAPRCPGGKPTARHVRGSPLRGAAPKPKLRHATVVSSSDHLAAHGTPQLYCTAGRTRTLPRFAPATTGTKSHSQSADGIPSGDGTCTVSLITHLKGA